MTFKNIPFFRILLILILAGFLYIYYTQMDIGRYQSVPGGLIVDTKTGECSQQRVVGNSKNYAPKTETLIKDYINQKDSIP